MCLQSSYHINDMHDILDFPYSLYSHVSNQQQQQQQALLQNKLVVTTG